MADRDEFGDPSEDGNQEGNDFLEDGVDREERPDGVDDYLNSQLQKFTGESPAPEPPEPTANEEPDTGDTEEEDVSDSRPMTIPDVQHYQPPPQVPEPGDSIPGFVAGGETAGGEAPGGPPDSLLDYFQRNTEEGAEGGASTDGEDVMPDLGEGDDSGNEQEHEQQVFDSDYEFKQKSSEMMIEHSRRIDELVRFLETERL